MINSFRDLHGDPGAFVIPNPWDVGSARMLCAMGFSALATTSAGMAFAMGLREGQADRAAVLNHCRDIVGATDLPVSADLEHGFGHDPANAAETIRAAADIGLAGCSLEDHTGDPDAPIYDFNHAVDRIAAASEAARALPDDFVLTARAEGLLWGSTDLDDIIRRLQAFEAAGADVLYAPGLKDLDVISTVCASLQKPVNVVMGMPGATFSVAELAHAGVRRISVGSALARRAYGAFIDAAREIAGQGSFTYSDRAMGFAEIEALLPPGVTGK
ncbi:isocitrate lyase/PEP mutase family protein [Sulfitobacter sp. MF3-043]|uniref:isocitrate lyase/PEP mutase family protein n=1 Tax=Sulfitobacter sediminivivens TaxID=3252902 RepID=UPI0036DAF571